MGLLPVPSPLESYSVEFPPPALCPQPVPAATDRPDPPSVCPAPASAAGSPEAQPALLPSAPCKLQAAPLLQPLEPLARVTSASGRGAGRFAATDFTRRDPHTLLCPAGKPLRASERRAQSGQERIRFEARASHCRTCPLADQCLGAGNSGRRGRRVSVIAPPRRSSGLPAEVSCQGEAVGASSAAELTSVSTSTAPARPSPAPGPGPMLWVDIPAAELRRFLPTLLLLLRFDLLPPLIPPTSPAPQAPVPRARVAHRRLTYEQRLQRNALPQNTVAGSICIHGLPASISEYLAQLGREPRAA